VLGVISSDKLVGYPFRERLDFLDSLHYHLGSYNTVFTETQAPQINNSTKFLGALSH